MAERVELAERADVLAVFDVAGPARRVVDQLQGLWVDPCDVPREGELLRGVAGAVGEVHRQAGAVVVRFTRAQIGDQAPVWVLGEHDPLHRVDDAAGGVSRKVTGRLGVATGAAVLEHLPCDLGAGVDGAQKWQVLRRIVAVDDEFLGLDARDGDPSAVEPQDGVTHRARNARDARQKPAARLGRQVTTVSVGGQLATAGKADHAADRRGHDRGDGVADSAGHRQNAVDKPLDDVLAGVDKPFPRVGEDIANLPRDPAQDADHFLHLGHDSGHCARSGRLEILHGLTHGGNQPQESVLGHGNRPHDDGAQVLTHRLETVSDVREVARKDVGGQACALTEDAEYRRDHVVPHRSQHITDKLESDLDLLEHTLQDGPHDLRGGLDRHPHRLDHRGADSSDPVREDLPPLEEEIEDRADDVPHLPRLVRDALPCVCHRRGQ